MRSTLNSVNVNRVKSVLIKYKCRHSDLLLPKDDFIEVNIPTGKSIIKSCQDHLDNLCISHNGIHFDQVLY